MTAIKQIEDALKAGPTDGPWIAAGPSRGMALPQYLNEVVVNREGDDDDTYLVCACPLGLDGDQGSSVTMDYIAVCNPANMREVLTNIAAQDAEIARLREALIIHHNHCCKTQPEYSEFGEDRVAYRATAAALTPTTPKAPA